VSFRNGARPIETRRDSVRFSLDTTPPACDFTVLLLSLGTVQPRTSLLAAGRTFGDRAMAAIATNACNTSIFYRRRELCDGCTA
jgi:hypothetical protein